MIFCVLVCKGKILLHILMASVMCLYLVCNWKILLSTLMTLIMCFIFSMQWVDIIEHTIAKCHLCML